MPVLYKTGSYVTAMYFEDHNPPHVHVVGPDFEGLVAIGDLAVFRGSIPSRFCVKRSNGSTKTAKHYWANGMPGTNWRCLRMDTLPRVKSVVAGKKGLVLDVVWSDNSKSRVDLTGLIHRSKHFRVFIDNAKAFQAVAPVSFGSGIGWKNGLDYSAATLHTLAEEQRPMKGKDLAAFEQKHDLNTAEVAALLEIAERTVRAYRTANVLPTTIAMSLRSLDADPARFAAHFRPIERRDRGRPRKAVRA